MTSCTRFEDEGLLLLEQGETLDEHFYTCEDCIAARKAYENLKASLHDIDDGAEPAPGWQDAVLAEVRASDASAGWRRWSAMAAGLAAVAIVVSLVMTQGPQTAGIDVRVSSGETVYRSETAAVGDELEVTVSTGGAAHAEVRVYLDGERLILACSDASPCSRDGRSISATLALTALGRYEAVLLLSDEPLPPPAGNLDADVLAARDSGATVSFGDPVDVR